MTHWLERLRSRYWGWASLAVIAAGTALTLWASSTVQRVSNEKATVYFEGHADRLQQEIINRIQRAEYGLQGIRSVMIAKPDLSQADFKATMEARDMWLEFRGVRGFGVIERVERRNLEAFTERRRRGGDGTYAVRTSGAAPDLFIVKYIEPAAVNRSALGFDLGSEPIRREVLAKAASLGEPTLTPRLVLLQDERASAGLVYLLPIYAGPVQKVVNGQPPGPLVGYVHAAIVVAEILGDLESFVEFSLDMRLYEGNPSEGRLMLDSQRPVDLRLPMPPDTSYDGRLLKTERQFSIGNRLFTLQMAGKPAMEQDLTGPYRRAMLVAVGGMLLTSLVALAFSLLARGQARAQRMARHMTADLEQARQALETSNDKLHVTMAGLSAREKLMRLITDNIPGRIVYWDRSGHCRFANREFLEAYGKSRTEVIGHHANEIFGSGMDPLRAARVEATLAGEYLIFEEFGTGSTREGRATTRQVHFIPDTQAGEVCGFFALGVDITELRQARDDALRASQAKSQFVANMSHELRTPMNAVLGMLQLVQHTPLTGQQHAYISKAQGAAQALLIVLNDILDFSKVEAGKMTLDPRPFEFDALLGDLSVIFAASVGSGPVEFIYDIHPDLPPRLVGDDMRLRQILINLGGNAVKFTEQGLVTLALRPVALTPGMVTVEFSVTDTGIGIATENVQRLFQDFGQAEASTTRRFGGTGLGLAICRKLIALMGGELQVVSAPGQGSCFSFRIPLPLCDSGRVTDRQSPGPAQRVLLVDTPGASRQAHAAMIAMLGWQVHCVDNGQQAQAALQVMPGGFDALLVDWLAGAQVPLATARDLGQLLPEGGPCVVVVGTCEVNELLAQLEPSRQRQIAGCLTRPLTPGMIASAVAQARAPDAGHVVPAALDDQPLAGLRLLVAEDNENNQMVARELLSAQGAQVDIAQDGLQAVERMRAGGRFDAILMDWQMPRMDGLQACAEIRAMGFETLPIIAMTANAMDSDRTQCLAAGMNDHIAKPFALRQLVATLLRHTGRAPAAPTALTDEPPSSPGAATSVPTEPPALLDRQAALEQMGGSEELYEQLLPIFHDDLVQTLEAIALALHEGGDRVTTCRQVHTLKGTAGTLGAMQLAAAARDMEAALKEQHQEALAFAHLREVAQQTRTALMP